MDSEDSEASTNSETSGSDTDSVVSTANQLSPESQENVNPVDVAVQHFKRMALHYEHDFFPPLTTVELTSYPKALKPRIPWGRLTLDMKSAAAPRIGTGKSLEPNVIEYETLKNMPAGDIIAMLTTNTITVVKNGAIGIQIDTADFSVPNFLKGEEDMELPGGYFVQSLKRTGWFYESDTKGGTVRDFNRERIANLQSEEPRNAASILNFRPSGANKIWNNFVNNVTKLPDPIRPDGTSSLQCLEEVAIEGITTWQALLKQRGTITGGHQEDSFAWSVNVCLYGSSNWIAVRKEDVPLVFSVAQEKYNAKFPREKKKFPFIMGQTGFFPIGDELREKGVDTIEFTQHEGEIVLVGCGNLHAVIGNEQSVHAATNVFPNITTMWQSAFEFEQIYNKSPRQKQVRAKELLLKCVAKGWQIGKGPRFLFTIADALWSLVQQKASDDLTVKALKWKIATGRESDEWENFPCYSQRFFCTKCYVEIVTPIIILVSKKKSYCCNCAASEKENLQWRVLERHFTYKYLVEQLEKVMIQLKRINDSEVTAVSGLPEARQAPELPSTSAERGAKRPRAKVRQKQSRDEDRIILTRQEAEKSLELHYTETRTVYRCSICRDQGIDEAYQKENKAIMVRHVLTCHSKGVLKRCNFEKGGVRCSYETYKGRAFSAHKRSHGCEGQSQ